MKDKIALIYGGTSTERKISLKSGAAVFKALKEQNYNVIKIDPKKDDLYEILKKEKPDVAFIALHGKGGEDGSIQGLLDFLKIKYTGNSMLASALTINKIYAQNILKSNNIKTPEFITISKEEYKKIDINYIIKKIKKTFDFPVVIKAPNQGSTLGIYPIINDMKNSYLKQLKQALKNIFVLEDNVLIEEMITPNTEITISVLGNSNPIILPEIEIITDNGFFDFNSKYSKGLTSHIIPSNLPLNIRNNAKKIALKIYKLFQCKGFVRIDFLIKNNIIYVIDINTIPGLTNISLFPEAAKFIGISFNNLIKIIIELSKRKNFLLNKYKNNKIKIKGEKNC